MWLWDKVSRIEHILYMCPAWAAFKWILYTRLRRTILAVVLLLYEDKIFYICIIYICWTGVSSERHKIQEVFFYTSNVAAGENILKCQEKTRNIIWVYFFYTACM